MKELFLFCLVSFYSIQLVTNLPESNANKRDRYPLSTFEDIKYDIFHYCNITFSELLLIFLTRIFGIYEGHCSTERQIYDRRHMILSYRPKPE